MHMAELWVGGTPDRDSTSVKGQDFGPFPDQTEASREQFIPSSRAVVPEVGSSRPPISSLRLCLTRVCSYLMGDYADPMDWEGAGSDSESPRTVRCMKREGSLIVFLHLTIHVHSNSLDVA